MARLGTTRHQGEEVDPSRAEAGSDDQIEMARRMAGVKPGVVVCGEPGRGATRTLAPGGKASAADLSRESR